MNDDVYVITGGAGGMGLASARALAERGQLLLLDLSSETLDAACDDLRASGATVDSLRCDVTSETDVAALEPKIRAMGTFKALVHTAGVSPLMGDGRKVLDVDLAGTVRITDAVFPLVGPGSSAVLIGSIAAYAGVDERIETLLNDPTAEDFVENVESASEGDLSGAAAYVIAKRGVVKLTERLSATWGAKGGRVVSIAPGLIDTPMGRMELDGQPLIPAMIEATPVKRSDQVLPGRPEDIASAVAFLVSDQAGFISGCDLRVDGGLIGGASSSFGT